MLHTKEQLLQKFLDGTFAGMTDIQIGKKLGVTGDGKIKLRKLLRELCDEGKLCRDYFFHYGTPEQLGAIKGKISGNGRGFGFLMPEDKSYGHDFFIPKRFMHGARHADTVYCVPVRDARSDDEAEVIAIVERGMKEIVGTYHRRGGEGYLVPDEKKFDAEVFIPASRSKNCRNGDKAVARITDYPKEKSPVGEIIEILQAENEFLLDELSIIRSYSLREEFPDEVKRAAQKVASSPIPEQEIRRRRDFRDEIIVTVDGEDTRDIDDAISVKREENGFSLGVHIADVSEYVRFKGVLDQEAFSRGTSVYFPDRVLPMLPRELSNGICSLNEGEDRLALSCLMHIDQNGNVVKSEIAKSVIRSTHRMTYHEVTAILEGDEDVCARFADAVPMLRDAKELTDILTRMREKKGCLELDVKEAHIMVDSYGEIVIPDYNRTVSENMIEQFMVIANETVATYMAALSAPFVYRVHEKPSEEKALAFKEFLQGLGVKERLKPEDVHPYDYQKILSDVKDLPLYPVVNRVMLRSMMKARYSPVNAGHFGLASDCYCHFTSPIRRYPDLTIHRIIKDVLDGNYGEISGKYVPFVSEAAQQSSETERKAQEAERDVDDLYTVMYMSKRIGEEYDAVVSGVTSFGIFAELNSAVEGFIPIETLPKDDYAYIEERYMLKGARLSLRIGEGIRVRVVACHFDTRRTEFCLLGKTES